MPYPSGQRKLVTRSCACGCGGLFTAKNGGHRYLNPSHRPREDRSKWDNKVFRRQRRIAGFQVRKGGVRLWTVRARDCAECVVAARPSAGRSFASRSPSLKRRSRRG
jgi:hypothetical protein